MWAIHQTDSEKLGKQPASNCGSSPGGRQRPRTCLEDLVADGESRPVRLVVGDELDEQLAAAGDDGRRSDLPAELPHHGRGLVAAVVDLHVVVPAEEGGGGEEETAALSFMKHRTHGTTPTDVDGSGADPSDKSLIVSDIKLRT